MTVEARFYWSDNNLMRSQEKWRLGDSRQTLHRTRAPVIEHYELDFKVYEPAELLLSSS